MKITNNVYKIFCFYSNNWPKKWILVIEMENISKVSLSIFAEISSWYILNHEWWKNAVAAIEKQEKNA